MRVAVINLDRREDRRGQFADWNARADLTIEFVSAAEGSALNRDELITQSVLAADDSHEFKDGAVGCAVSHRRLWERVAASGEPLLICEDDCCLRADFAEAAAALVARLPADWDIVYMGFNTNAAVAAESGEGLQHILTMNDSAKREPEFFERYARAATVLAPSTLLRCYQAWGTLCYYLSPAGARKLLTHCFPMTNTTHIVVFGQNRTAPPKGIDGMMNVALQRAPIESFCVFPPLALSPHVRAESDNRNRANAAGP